MNEEEKTLPLHSTLTSLTLRTWTRVDSALCRTELIDAMLFEPSSASPPTLLIWSAGVDHGTHPKKANPGQPCALYISFPIECFLRTE